MSQIEAERRQEEAEAHIRATAIKELCEVMQKTGLPPMAVLRLAARSVGTIYREMADAHAVLDPVLAAGVLTKPPTLRFSKWR